MVSFWCFGGFVSVFRVLVHAVFRDIVPRSSVPRGKIEEATTGLKFFDGNIIT